MPRNANLLIGVFALGSSTDTPVCAIFHFPSPNGRKSRETPTPVDHDQTNRLESMPTEPPAPIDSIRLTEVLSPLHATLTKKRGGWVGHKRTAFSLSPLHPPARRQQASRGSKCEVKPPSSLVCGHRPSVGAHGSRPLRARRLPRPGRGPKIRIQHLRPTGPRGRLAAHLAEHGFRGFALGC